MFYLLFYIYTYIYQIFFKWHNITAQFSTNRADKLNYSKFQRINAISLVLVVSYIVIHPLHIDCKYINSKS